MDYYFFTISVYRLFPKFTQDYGLFRPLLTGPQQRIKKYFKQEIDENIRGWSQ